MIVKFKKIYQKLIQQNLVLTGLKFKFILNLPWKLEFFEIQILFIMEKKIRSLNSFFHFFFVYIKLDFSLIDHDEKKFSKFQNFQFFFCLILINFQFNQSIN